MTQKTERDKSFSRTIDVGPGQCTNSFNVR